MQPLLSIESVSKRFAAHQALRDIDLSVDAGEFIALLGPSGCGKTTLLRCIAGFLMPDSGRIVIDGENITSAPPHRRPLNTVFQSYALFPHMSVLDNVAYGPRRAGVGRAEAHARACDALDLVGLGEMGPRLPRELSGGQQQRVALARAIVNRPKLLLLDEPLSALDLKLRRRMQVELKHIQEKLGIAFIFVTHDQEEAMAMADRIVVMNAGRVEQIGTPSQIYRAPVSRFVAEFVGEPNLIPVQQAGPGRVRLAIAGLELPAADGMRCAMVRPEDISLIEGTAPDGIATAPGVVEEVLAIGPMTTLLVRCGDLQLKVARLGMSGTEFPAGSPVTLGLRPAALHLIAE
ncbi:ABC transporter ATP-binding protein [Ancylobacter pratisalsi]|uniref:ABC transporter ATP-binding protein n=1 Tax=Ancylobacter pratisalsi TaxID=1745854 RepID=A0A6P1YUL5_9HYPH|nr:ABC transporter ATP-binding protein [Ancylobacter pratisalsi]QIB35773.1 ABC transporter ATP-binding protein [Ancylobacter pratisalsi]